jgi:hypothetical protein
MGAEDQEVVVVGESGEPNPKQGRSVEGEGPPQYFACPLPCGGLAEVCALKRAAGVGEQLPRAVGSATEREAESVVPRDHSGQCAGKGRHVQRPGEAPRGRDDVGPALRFQAPDP